MTDQEEIQRMIANAALKLAEFAFECGFTLTIETVPRKPLALGNYDLEIEVRESHANYRSQS